MGLVAVLRYGLMSCDLAASQHISPAEEVK